jgi:hypothetical protein
MGTTLHIGDRGPAVKKLQREVNTTFRNRHFSFRTIDPDEIFGEETQKAARFAGWLMGFSHGQLNKIEDGIITSYSYSALIHERAQSEAAKQRDLKREPTARKLRFMHNHPAPKPVARGVATFDGVPVAAWMVKWLKKSRANGWTGELVSGFRSPEHSERVCRDMCGQPTCPGRCAGRSSNHVGLIHPAGAIDVTEELRFAAIQPKIGSPLRNDLPSDLIHFSTTGH